ncbi:MAG: methyltransferase domain-containing protein [Planctomycetaceae bacterium]
MQCSYFQQGICRSCSQLDKPYHQTVTTKHHALAALFPDVRIQDFRISEAAGARIRARIAISGSIAAPEFGFLDQTRKLVAVDQCPLHHPRINGLIESLKPLIAEYRLHPWSVTTGKGELRHIIVTVSPLDGRMMLQFVLRSREAVDRIRSLWRCHRDNVLSSVDVLSVNLQPGRTSQLTGDTEIPISDSSEFRILYQLSEDQTSTDSNEASAVGLYYGPQSFVQTNHAVATRLYCEARNILQSHGCTRVLDVYCGVGAFSLLAIGGQNQDGRGVSIHGFDISEDSIHCAQRSAVAIKNLETHFEVADAATCQATRTSFSTDSNGSAFDAVICNPPRRGLDEGVLQLLDRTPAPMVLYSSCNPMTLARDLVRLSGTYRFEQLTPFDMFPFSEHMEVLAVGFAR